MNLRAMTVLAVVLCSCAAQQVRDANGKLELNPNQLTHEADTAFSCFTFISNGGERKECAMSEGLCQQRVAARKAENFEVPGACSPRDGVFCFAWAAGEATNAECYDNEPDCTEMSAAVVNRPNIGAQNVSACKPFGRSHQSY